MDNKIAWYCPFIMENIESSWNILMDINFKILQSKYFNDMNFEYDFLMNFYLILPLSDSD